ncbi:MULTISPECIES: alpha-amylase family glycosyl hydrolase [Stenotrophomonas]|uniref:Alpha-amylase family glycosyl hydrolase n=1 Tax=Stenotrophomonas bentonitica TaxID=1450134 RepID=A0ABU9JQM2_9GAMM|nr:MULTISPECIES: alpha-amylase family glycosyl hydrolase [unclassified Stenotrophomonas]AOX63287.1 cyclomaltodextrin glucanotransferase [Stenotrophomonas sp. LM091]
MSRYSSLSLALSFVLSASPALAVERPDYVGTREPFASQAVYFVVTDRFVNGDPSNDHRDQGGAHPTFDIPVPCPDKVDGNIGYLGGDFKGVLDNAAYIRNLGFGAVWITPIIDNPDQAFTGSKPISCTSTLTDRGKTGYHGYWGVNFYTLDEHLPSKDLDFADFTRGLHAADLKVVLDIVGNHGSPAWTMPVAQLQFGQIFDKDGRLIADHQNLPPQQLDPVHNPLHAFYNNIGPVDGKSGSIFDGNLAELSDFNEHNPAVMDYLVGAYLQWTAQGVDALRIDTIGWLPHPWWHAFVNRIRAEHPGMFMFGEAFDYDASKIAEHTWPANANVSVLDFPLRGALSSVFGKEQKGFETLAEPLHLLHGPYANPYELMSFYDNHDMARLDATDAGFIDAHNWLFTARGIPVIYYGSETGFMRSRAEHAGNRAYFGQKRVDEAPKSPIYAPLQRIAKLREATPALQRGLQVNERLHGDEAVFFRVLQQGDTAQTALVLLNKGDTARTLEVRRYLQAGTWRDALGGASQTVKGSLTAEVPAHGVRVFVLDAPVDQTALQQQLKAAVDDQRARTKRLAK